MSALSWKPGQDPNKRDGPGRTPLHILCHQKPFSASDVQVLKQLLEAGASPNVYDTFLRTPLSLITMETGNSEAVRSLVQAGADVNARDEWERTSLHWCCDRGWTDAAAILLENGADVNAVTKHGDTPLLWAAKSGRSRLVEMLLAAGCDPTLKNNRFESAADVATDDIVEALILSCSSKFLDASNASGVSEKVNESSSSVPDKDMETKSGNAFGRLAAVEDNGAENSSNEANDQHKPVAFSSYSTRDGLVAGGKKLKITLKKKGSQLDKSA